MSHAQVGEDSMEYLQQIGWSICVRWSVFYSSVLGEWDRDIAKILHLALSVSRVKTSGWPSVVVPSNGDFIAISLLKALCRDWTSSRVKTNGLTWWLDQMKMMFVHCYLSGGTVLERPFWNKGVFNNGGSLATPSLWFSVGSLFSFSSSLCCCVHS
jgi:hypothetical protein